MRFPVTISLRLLSLMALFAIPPVPSSGFQPPAAPETMPSPARSRLPETAPLSSPPLRQVSDPRPPGTLPRAAQPKRSSIPALHPAVSSPPELTPPPASPTPAPTLTAHPVGDIFGLGTFVTQRSLAVASPLIGRVRLAGAGWVREELTATRLHDGTDASYDWAPYDRVVNAERRAGLQVLGLLDYSNTWGYGDHGTMPHDDIAQLSSDFAAYAHAAALHFRGRIRYWQLWNEPNLPVYWHPAPNPDDYALLVSAASRAIKQAEPGARIVLGGVNGVDLPFLQAVASRATGFDILAVHPYRDLPEDNLLSQISALQTFGKPLWFSEIGWPAGDGCSACPDESQQASYLVRFYALAAAAGVQRIFWYDFRDDDHSPNPSELHFGLLRRDLRAKPAFAAYAFLAHILRGDTFVSAEHLGDDGIFTLRFERGNGPLALIWNTGAMANDVAIRWPGKTAVAVSVSGTVLGRVPVRDGTVTWLSQPDGSPVYILGSTPRYRVPVLTSLAIPRASPLSVAPKHVRPTRHLPVEKRTHAAPHAQQRALRRGRTHSLTDPEHLIPRTRRAAAGPSPTAVELPLTSVPALDTPSPTPSPPATATPTPEPTPLTEATLGTDIVTPEPTAMVISLSPPTPSATPAPAIQVDGQRH